MWTHAQRQNMAEQENTWKLGEVRTSERGRGMGRGRRGAMHSISVGLLLVMLTVTAVHTSGVLAQDATAEEQQAEKKALLEISGALKAWSQVFNGTYTNESPRPFWWSRNGWSNVSSLPCSPTLPKWKFIVCNAQKRVEQITLDKLSTQAATPTGSIFLRGQVPWASVAALSALTKLDLTGQRVNGTLLPPDAPPLPSLKTLILGQCGFSSFSEQITQLASIEKLIVEAQGGRMEGSIPSSISVLTALSELNLMMNLISGPIPPEMGSMPSLKSLDLSINNISGSLPDTLSQLTGLTSLAVAGNAITGFMPSSFSTLTGLVELDVGGNSFLSLFPVAPLSLSALTLLDVSNNQFFGEVPVSIWQRSNLKLDVSDNWFNGMVPVLGDRGSYASVEYDMNCFNYTPGGGGLFGSSYQGRKTDNCTWFYTTIAPNVPPSQDAGSGSGSTSPPPGNSSDVGVPYSSGSSAGLIAGVTIAAVVVALGIAGLLVWFLVFQNDGDDYDDEGEDEEEGEEDKGEYYDEEKSSKSSGSH